MSWKVDEEGELRKRFERLKYIKSKKDGILQARYYYEKNPIDFINHWAVTLDPRGSSTNQTIPFILFPKQEEFIHYMQSMILHQTSGIVEKSRDMGATWLCCAYAVWLFAFNKGAQIRFASQKAQNVDSLGKTDGIFEKLRTILRYIPKFLLPPDFDIDNKYYSKQGNIYSGKDWGSAIGGLSGTQLGRGGRASCCIIDEAAHLHDQENAEASTEHTTDVQIWVSSVYGVGNLFHRKSESGVLWTKDCVPSRKYSNLFILDWKDDPRKSQKWYDDKKELHKNNGTLHLFAQEVDRDYASANPDTIIQLEWINASIDAHKKLDMEEMGWVGGWDIADGGADRNALAIRKGVILRHLEEWHAPTVAHSARRVAKICKDKEKINLQYDKVSIGSAVAGEVLRLIDDGVISDEIKFIGWNGGASPQDKDKKVYPTSKKGVLNGEYFANLKAQGWIRLRNRFENTFMALNQGIKFPPEDLISIDSRMPLLNVLKKELLQATATTNNSCKILVDKDPEGVKSPDLADAVVMCYNPIREKKAWVMPQNIHSLRR